MSHKNDLRSSNLNFMPLFSLRRDMRQKLESLGHMDHGSTAMSGIFL